MDEERWERLLEHLRQARSRPEFDAEERGYRLAVAAELRAVVELAAAGAPWTQRFEAVFTGIFNGRRYDLTDRSTRRWVKSFSTQELGRAMGCFLDEAATPAERFAAFLGAAAEQRPQLAAPAEDLVEPDPDRAAVLAVGSLLAFGCDPEAVPVIALERWSLVERTLGLATSFRFAPAEEFARHLAFAADVQHRLGAAGVEASDMLDTQSLLQLAAMQADFWAANRQRGYVAGDRSRTPSPKSYLSVCAIYRDEASNLAEWVEFHRLVGVERFFLYNNFSEDDHMDVLAPYIDDGLVTVRDWPVLDGRVGQIAAYDDALRWHRYDSRWIAFIDLDEFLFSPGSSSLPDVLSEFEEWPAVALRWAMFATSGHETRPPGLVIENFRRRIDFDGNINMKTVADPTRVTRCLSAHHFEYPYLSAVDENHVPMWGTRTATDSVERLRLNHYHWKSKEEYVAKCARMHAIGRPRDIPGPEHFEWLARAERSGADDEAILRWAPALRDALAAR